MLSEKKGSMQSFKGFGQSLFLVTIGSLIIHCFVVLVKAYLSGELNEIGNINVIFDHIISIKMIPIILSYVMLISLSFYFYRKTKATMEILNKKELNNQKTKIILETSQITSGILINMIQGHNAELKKWLLERESEGNTPPEKVKEINRKIERSLSALSRRFFLDPYIEKDFINGNHKDHNDKDMLAFSRNLQSYLSGADEYY